MKIIIISTMLNIEKYKNLIASYARIEKLFRQQKAFVQTLKRMNKS